jgi:site-specific recombinase XerC
MRRAAICHLDLSEIDLETRNVTVREKGGHSHRYKISKEGAKAIRDYLNEERGVGGRDRYGRSGLRRNSRRRMPCGC